MRLALASAVGVLAANPVDNVVKMLEDMAAQLTTDAKNDKKVYDKLSCWCKATIPAAEEAIAAAETCIKEETATRNAQTGIANERASQIAKLEESIKEKQSELKAKNDEAAKKTQDQQSNDAELTKIITAIDGALEKLSGGKAFLQVNEKEMAKTAVVLRSAMDNYGMRLVSVLRPSQRKLLSSFIAQPSYGAYANQSGQIVGILKSMKDEFTADQENAAAEYEKYMAAYSEAKAILEETIASEQAAVTKKTEEQLAAEAAASDAQVAAEECKKQLEDETGLRASSIETCQTAAKDYETRTGDRAKEQQAVAEALKILTSEEIRSTFDKMSGAVSFLQESSSEETQIHKAKKVTAALRAAGQKFKDARFMILAQQVSMLKKREGWQKKVCAAVKKVISEIETDIANDLEEKDGCVTAQNDMNRKIGDLENDISSSSADLDAINTAIDTLTAQIEEHQTIIAGKEKDMNQMTDQRTEEHKNFLEQQAFDRASVKFIKQAMAVLDSVYKQNSFLQQQPGGFKDYKQSQGGTVLTALQNIVNDTEQALADNLTEENAAQAVYEQFVKETTASIEAGTKIVNTKTGEKAQKETERVNEEKVLRGLEEEKTAEEKALEAKKTSCKFIQDNFEVRKTAMNQEKKELVDALTILEC